MLWPDLKCNVLWLQLRLWLRLRLRLRLHTATGLDMSYHGPERHIYM